MASKGPTSGLGGNKLDENEYAKRFKINREYLTNDFQNFIRSGIEGITL
jgi:hypothetical protein